MRSLTLLLRSILLNLYIVRYRPHVFTNNAFCEIHSIKTFFFFRPILVHLPALPPCLPLLCHYLSTTLCRPFYEHHTCFIHKPPVNIMTHLISPRSFRPTEPHTPPLMPVTHTSRSPRSLLPPPRMMATHSHITSISHPHALSQITTLDHTTSEPPPHHSPWNK